jgi:hypothetical protein
MTAFHFFTDIDVLGSQSATDAFGPLSASTYQVTSMHRPVGSAAPAAYAVCDGQVLVQDAGSGLVNLVLKPTSQPPFAFPKIKFFVYRGIQKSSLLNSNEVAAATSNDLTKSIWESQEARNTSAGTSDNPPAEALGVDLTGTGSIDEVFYRDNVSYQLPLVRSGWSLGQFSSSAFGFEIMFDAIGFDPALSLIRTQTNMITVAALPSSPTQAQEFEHWHDKEAILGYVDPCAFFGSFIFSKLNVHKSGTSTTAKRNEIYDDVLAGVFLNRNRIYVDIRNEFGRSVNYFKNYGTYSDTTIQCAFEKSTTLGPRNYYFSGWPLLILEPGDFPTGNTSSKKNVVRVALPDGAGDNPRPTLYVSAGYPLRSYPRAPKAAAKLLDLATSGGFSDEVAFAVPNRTGQAATTPVCSYLQVKYCKRFDPAATSQPASSGTVIRASGYLDQFFATVDVTSPRGSTLRTTVRHPEIFVDAAQTLQTDFIANTGRSESTLNVTLFAFAILARDRERDAARSGFMLRGANKDAKSEYLQDISIDYPNLQLEKETLQTGSGTVSVLRYADDLAANGGRFDRPSPADLWALVFAGGEFDAVRALATDPSKFAQRLPIYVGIRDKTSAVDTENRPYTTFELVLRGYRLQGTSYVVAEEPTFITQYAHGTL